MKREGQILEHKFLCCNVDSKYLIVDISKKNHNDYRNNATYQKWKLLVFERDKELYQNIIVDDKPSSYNILQDFLILI